MAKKEIEKNLVKIVKDLRKNNLEDLILNVKGSPYEVQEILNNIKGVKKFFARYCVVDLNKKHDLTISLCSATEDCDKPLSSDTYSDARVCSNTQEKKESIFEDLPFNITNGFVVCDHKDLSLFAIFFDGEEIDYQESVIFAFREYYKDDLGSLGYHV